MSALVPDPSRPKRSQLQLGAAGFGVVFLLVGIAGFIPGITTHYMDMQVAGQGSDALLLGLFRVSALHNVVHLLYGVAGLALSGTVLRASRYLFFGGIGYGAIFLYGLLTPYGSGANFIPLNAPDDALHIGLAIAMMTAALVLDRGPAWSDVLVEHRADV